MRTIRLTTAMFCLALVAAVACAGTRASWEWIAREKMRGAYFYQSEGREHFGKLAECGFNAALIKYGDLDVFDPAGDTGPVAHLKRAAAWAHESGLRFFPVINFAGSNERGPLKATFRPLVSRTGRVAADTPCPRDARYWDRVIGDRGVFIAQLARTATIAGLIIDPEMYGAGSVVYSPDGCFCDDCFQAFLRARNLDLTLPPAGERFDLLTRRGLLADYRAFLEDEVAAIAARQRDRIRAANADLLLGGFLLDRDDFYHRALVRGLSEPEMPVLVLPETTYGSGYTSAVPAAIARLKQLNAPFLYIGGLWISKFLPDYIGAHAYHMAVNADGYWLFTTFSLARPRSELSGDYAIPAAAGEYWRALSLANANISRKMRDPGYTSSLIIRPGPPIIPSVAAPDMAILKRLAPLAPRDAGFKPQPIGQLPRLRGPHVFALLLRKGEPCTLTLACQRLGSYNEGAAMTVTTPAGGEAARAHVGYGETTSVSFTAPEDGAYGVAATAGANTFSLQASAQHFTAVGSKMAFCNVGGRVYFYVPGQTKEFAVALEAGGGEETARVVVYDPTGGLAAEAEDVAEGAAQAKVTVAEGAADKVWSLAVGPAREGTFEDAAVTLLPPLPPLLAYSAEGLLAPAGIAQGGAGP